MILITKDELCFALLLHGEGTQAEKGHDDPGSLRILFLLLHGEGVDAPWAVAAITESPQVWCQGSSPSLWDTVAPDTARWPRRLCCCS